MSVKMKTDPDPYLWDEDEPPPKGVQSKGAKYAGDIKSARDELFEKGSDFLPTARNQIVGIDNVLIDIDDIVHWLKHSKAYQRHGARLEPGVIFEGDPGTGKTLVSRYIATESGALFINVRDFPHAGSLFKDSDIRDLFKRARQKYKETGSPIVLFWDEFENGAVERSAGTPEQVATVSQLTAELDGVHGKNEGILLIGCTNYIYGIDAALRRSGRMGLQIEFIAPDREGKCLLLDYYLKQYNTTGQIDIDTLSYFLESDDTAADIEEACMEAWRYAVRRTLKESGANTRKKPILTQKDLIEVFTKRLVGPPTMFVNLPMDDRCRIALHEVGHAAMALVYGIPMRLITVQPGKKSLGRCIIAEISEHIGTMDEMMAQLRVGLGSVVAERVARCPASLGASGDIEMVNTLATKLVDNLYAGSRTGMFTAKAAGKVRADRMGGASPNVSDYSVAQSDRDVTDLLRRIEEEIYKSLIRIGEENLWKIAKIVNEKVTMTGAEFHEAFVSVTGCEPSIYRV